LSYGLAAGLSRAGGLLSIPIAAHALSLAETGHYAMGMALVQVLSHVLSLGGGAAVSREGSSSPRLARALAIQFSLLALVLAVLLSFFVSLLRLESLWILFIYLAAHEAMQQLMQLVLRAEDRVIPFLVFSVIKTFLWVLISGMLLVLSPIKYLSIETWLTLQLGVYSLVSLLFIFFRQEQKTADVSADVRAQGFFHHMPYCLPLIIHGLAQWVVNSSDKLVIGWILGNEQLGIYSLAYTVASVLLVLLHGLAVYLPHEIMKNMDKWLSPVVRFSFIKRYIFVYVLTYTVLLIAFLFDYKFIGILKYYHSSMPTIVGIVSAGFLLLGIYQVYVCFLFAVKDTVNLTKITLFISLTYLAYLFLFVYLFNTIGAALSTLLSYALYAIIVRRAASKVIFCDEQYIRGETHIALYGVLYCLSLGLIASYIMSFL